MMGKIRANRDHIECTAKGMIVKTCRHRLSGRLMMMGLIGILALTAITGPQRTMAVSAASVVATVTPQGEGPSSRPPVSTVTPSGPTIKPPVATVTPAGAPPIYAITVTPGPSAGPEEPSPTPTFTMTPDPPTPFPEITISVTPTATTITARIYLPLTMRGFTLGE